MRTYGQDNRELLVGSSLTDDLGERMEGLMSQEGSTRKYSGFGSVHIGNFTDDEREFILAMETYMKVNKRRFPSFTEVLAVAKSLGYRKVDTKETTTTNETTNGAQHVPNTV